MKLGLIVECAASGMEMTVLPKVLQLLSAEVRIPITPTIKTMTNKKQLILRGAEAASVLISNGCHRVVIFGTKTHRGRQLAISPTSDAGMWNASNF